MKITYSLFFNTLKNLKLHKISGTKGKSVDWEHLKCRDNGEVTSSYDINDGNIYIKYGEAGPSGGNGGNGGVPGKGGPPGSIHFLQLDEDTKNHTINIEAKEGILKNIDIFKIFISRNPENFINIQFTKMHYKYSFF